MCLPAVLALQHLLHPVKFVGVTKFSNAQTVDVCLLSDDVYNFSRLKKDDRCCLGRERPLSIVVKRTLIWPID